MHHDTGNLSIKVTTENFNGRIAKRAGNVQREEADELCRPIKRISIVLHETDMKRNHDDNRKSVEMQQTRFIYVLFLFARTHTHTRACTWTSALFC